MPFGVGRLRLPGEGTDFRDGLVPQIARRHLAQVAPCARIKELYRDGRGEGELEPADPGLNCHNAVNCGSRLAREFGVSARAFFTDPLHSRASPFPHLE